MNIKTTENSFMPNRFKGTNLVNERGVEERIQNRHKEILDIVSIKTSYDGCNT